MAGPVGWGSVGPCTVLPAGLLLAARAHFGQADQRLFWNTTLCVLFALKRVSWEKACQQADSPSFEEFLP